MKNFKKLLAVLMMLPLVVMFIAGLVAWWLVIPEPFKSMLTAPFVLTTLVGMFIAGAHWLDKLNKEK